MKHGLLFRALVGKELRMLCRDPQQLLGLFALIFSLAFVAIVMETAGDDQKKRKQDVEEAQRRLDELRKKLEAEAEESDGDAEAAAHPASAETDPASAGTDPPPEAGGEPAVKVDVPAVPEAAPSSDPKEVPPWAIRWIILLVSGLLAFYGSFFVVPLALASFVGEKEEGTVEVLLSAPVSDTRLYLFKTGSVALVGSLLGYLFLFLGFGYGLWKFGGRIGEIGIGLVLPPVLLSLLWPILFTGIQLGFGVIASVRAKTTKGAGQLFGGIVTILFLGGPLAAFGIWKTNLRVPLTEFGIWWMKSAFALQALIVFGTMTLFCAAGILIGWALFKRERMLA